MAIGLELTLRNGFSHASSFKNILTFKRSFVFICSKWLLACSPTKSAWAGCGVAQLPPPMAFLSFGVSTDRVAASCLAGFVTNRQSSFSIELFPCSSQPQHLSGGLFQTPYQRPVPLPSFGAAHSAEMIIIILGACRWPLS